jgi:hypothetical protein
MPYGKMIVSCFMLAVLVAVCSIVSWAQAPPTSTGVVVQSARYDPQKQAVVIRLVNTSGKAVTAYNLTVTETLADGTTGKVELMTDFLNTVIQGDPGFAAGTSRDEINRASQPVTNVSVVVDVVVYADQTAEVVNGGAYTRLVAMRKGDVLAKQKANELTAEALADPNISDPGKQVAAELDRLAAVIDGKHDYALDAPEPWMKTTLNSESQNILRNPDREWLKKLAKEREGEIALTIPHTKLKVSQ